MSQTNIDELMQRVQEVAQAVNQFKSEAIQQQVFELLMRASDVEVSPASDPIAEQNRRNTSEEIVKELPSENPGKKPVVKSNRGSGKKPNFVTKLNLRPSGKKSLKDIVGEKIPDTNEERFAVIVHYLQHDLSENNINQDHIYTAFKELNVKVPVDINNALTKCAERKGWIDTKDLSNVTLTTRGENFVEHDLPHGQDNK